MAGGGFVEPASAGKAYPGKLNREVVLTSVLAAMGGLIFGYDLGISGGVTSMDSFLKKFFPNVYVKEAHMTPSQNQYCKFDSPQLTFFTSCLYLAALGSCLVAGTITRVFGRRMSMLFGGFLFAAGALVNAFASVLWMLYVGRILLGFGIGCVNQAVPIYISEIAPSKYRGALNMLFQLAITIGILIANALNYGFAKIEGGWGWRLSLGGAVVPAAIIILGSFFLPETPNSLLERGHKERAKAQLLKLRGVPNVDEEFNDLVAASEESAKVKHPWRTLFSRRYRPQLVFACAIPAFQQLTGMNVIIFYAPVLFKTIGFGANASLMSSLITGAVNVVATFLSIATVDKFGRRFLFIEGGVQMLACQILVAAMIGSKFGISGNPHTISQNFATVVVVAICLYVAGFAWSWGPLGWLVPSEIYPLEIRSAAQSLTVSVNMIFTFAIAQVFTMLLCHLKFGLFIFFSAFIITMVSFIYKFFPETKGIPIEDMQTVWQKHPHWRKYYGDDKAVLDNTEIDLEKNNQQTV